MTLERTDRPSVGADMRYWSIPSDDLVRRLQSGGDGLTSADARRRLREYGPNALRDNRHLSRLRVLVNQVRSPLLLLLLFAAAASGVTREWLDAGMVLVIVLATVAVGYSREYSAQAAAGRSAPACTCAHGLYATAIRRP